MQDWSSGKKPVFEVQVWESGGHRVVPEAVGVKEITQEDCVALKQKKPRQNRGEHQQF